MTRISAAYLILVVVVTTLLLVLCPPLEAQSAGQEEARTASALREGKPVTALTLLGAALRRFPEDAQLWTMQGVAYSRVGRKREALASFEHALKIAPNTIPALKGAAQIEFDESDARAIPLLQRILRVRPRDLTTHGMLAVLEFQQGRCADAVPHFERAAELFHAQADALYAYAICLVRVKQLEKAADVLKLATELKSNNPQADRLLASVDLMAHKPQAALAALRPTLALKNPDAETLELASSAYEGIHNTERAVSALRRAILLEPSNADLYVEFANLCAVHQSFQVGINVMNDALALLPQAPSLYFARGMLYAQLSDYDKAQADFEAAYRLDPKQSLSTAALGLMAVQQNDLNGALKTVDEKLTRKPRDPVLLYLKAEILTQQGAENGSAKFGAALRSAQESIALNPALAPAHAVLAKLYLQSGEYHSAITECRKALNLDPRDQTSIYRLIQALRKAQQKKEIPTLLKRLAQLRQDATNEEHEQYRYKLVEGGASIP